MDYGGDAGKTATRTSPEERATKRYTTGKVYLTALCTMGFQNFPSPWDKELAETIQSRVRRPEKKSTFKGRAAVRDDCCPKGKPSHHLG